MALDAATLALVANELNSTLLDAKIDKIFEPTRDEVLMTLRTRTQRIENRRDFADNCGRIGTLNVPTTAQQLAETCSRMLHTHCKFVEADHPVEKLAEVSGAGGSYLQQAIDEGADCLVTGEAAHHIAILAKQKGVGLVVAGHWGTEHPVVFALTDALTERLPKEVTVAPSLADVDPYSYL